MNEEIKPCPFCGSKDVGVVPGTTFRWMFAFCSDCGAQAGEVRVQTLGQGNKDEWEAAARIRAVEEWNKRV
jgi:Lar family restriction alleviation protein